MNEGRIKYFSIRIGAFDADSQPVGFPLELGPISLTAEIAEKVSDTVLSVLDAFMSWPEEMKEEHNAE